MNLPFTVEQFFAVFREYNSAIWPLQVVAYVLGACAVGLAVLDRPQAGRAVFVILGAFWAWMGAVYHLAFFSPINPAARIFGVLFVVQGLLFLFFAARRPGIGFAYANRPIRIVGALFVLFGMAIYPLLGMAFGHRYPAVPVFGVAPCPTTIFTFGVLLWAKAAVPGFLVAIPFLWSVVGMGAAVSLGVPQDYGLVVAGVVGTGLIIRENRRKKLAGGAAGPWGGR